MTDDETHHRHHVRCSACGSEYWEPDVSCLPVHYMMHLLFCRTLLEHTVTRTLELICPECGDRQEFDSSWSVPGYKWTHTRLCGTTPELRVSDSQQAGQPIAEDAERRPDA